MKRGNISTSVFTFEYELELGTCADKLDSGRVCAVISIIDQDIRIYLIAIFLLKNWNIFCWEKLIQLVNLSTYVQGSYTSETMFWNKECKF